MRLKMRKIVYGTYWYLASERQEIFYKKINGLSMPYTNDKILQTYKFCNAYQLHQ